MVALMEGMMLKIEAWDEEGGGALIPAFVEPLTADDYARLTSGRRVMVTHKLATLVVGPQKPGGTEMRFKMVGPSGEHSLLVAATPLERLNAHWIVFASHPDNQTEAAR